MDWLIYIVHNTKKRKSEKKGKRGVGFYGASGVGSVHSGLYTTIVGSPKIIWMLVTVIEELPYMAVGSSVVKSR